MKNLRLALLCLAAIVALLLGASFLDRAFRSDVPPPEIASVPARPAIDHAADTKDLSAPRRKIDAAIAESPDYVRFFDRLRLVFPGEYDTILNTLAQGSAPSGKELSPDAIMADTVAALRKADGALAAKASDQALGQIFTLQLGEMRSLAAQDVHLCVAFLYGASGTGFLGFAAEHRALIADAAIAGLDAMNSGRMDQIQRGPPNDGDFQALDKALTEKGLSRPEIEALLDGKSADPPIADERMCVAGQTYLETLAGLPAAPRARLYGLAVDLMAKS
jgi:hypothetical protein